MGELDNKKVLFTHHIVSKKEWTKCSVAQTKKRLDKFKRAEKGLDMDGKSGAAQALSGGRNLKDWWLKEALKTFSTFLQATKQNREAGRGERQRGKVKFFWWFLAVNSLIQGNDYSWGDRITPAFTSSCLREADFLVPILWAPSLASPHRVVVEEPLKVVEVGCSLPGANLPMGWHWCCCCRCRWWWRWLDFYPAFLYTLGLKILCSAY